MVILGCDTAECNWDGLDCQNDGDEPAKGFLVFILLMPPTQFRNISVQFLRDIGHLIQAVLKVARDGEGREMIYAWPSEQFQGRSKRSAEFAIEPLQYHRYKRRSNGDVHG